MFNLIVKLMWIGALRRYGHDKPKVVVVCGSVGKTTAKESIADVLSQKYSVFRTPGNLGTDVGVPLALLGHHQQPLGYWGWLSAVFRSIFYQPPKKKADFYVLEYASDKSGDIDFLTSKIKPDIAVITTIVPVHQQFFTSWSEFVDEELAVLKHLKSGGLAVINADDGNQRVVESGKWKVKSAGYGIENKCQYRAEDLKLTNAGWSFAIDDLQIQSRLIGKHQIYSLLAAAAVGAELGVESEKIKAALENYQLPPGRGRIIEGIRDSIIVDDSYNSSPEAVKSGLAMVAEFRSKHRLVAILGRMNELGEKSEAAHAEIGQHAADKVDLLILVGEFAAKTADAAKQAGIEAYKVLCFETPENLMDDVRDLIQDNDLIYVKASQNGMRLERVVKKIMAHPETARENLVRQESFWGS